MTGRESGEPATPSPARDAFSVRWVLGWLAAATVTGAVLVAAWLAGFGISALGLLGLAVAVMLGVPLHHTVVTTDAGERIADRSDTTRQDLPPRLDRRWVLVAGSALTMLGLVALFGLRRFAPTRPPGSAWQEGRPLTLIDGRRLHPEDVPLGGVVTVWPEGFEGVERSAVMVIRLRDLPEPPTRMEGVVDETLVAYSRLCTHAGCAVALYRDLDQILFCPCHQATFDARRGARPTAGPASVALPQLPLGLGPDGHLIASGALTARPGPVGGTP